MTVHQVLNRKLVTQNDNLFFKSGLDPILDSIIEMLKGSHALPFSFISKAFHT